MKKLLDTDFAAYFEMGCIFIEDSEGYEHACIFAKDIPWYSEDFSGKDFAEIVLEHWLEGRAYCEEVEREDRLAAFLSSVESNPLYLWND